MGKRLKVYGGLVFRGPRQVRAVIAAYNAEEVARAHPGRCSAHYIRGYWSVTGNTKEVEAAMAQPGILLVEESERSGRFTAQPAAAGQGGLDP
jgi:hypothetical protein